MSKILESCYYYYNVKVTAAEITGRLAKVTDFWERGREYLGRPDFEVQNYLPDRRHAPHPGSGHELRLQNPSPQVIQTSLPPENPWIPEKIDPMTSPGSVAGLVP